MERVTGIGGVFLRSRDPAALSAWYAAHLGLDVEEWHGSVLRAAGGETATWALFPADTEYFGRLDQQAMINYRVNDLEAMLAQLRGAGVAVEGPMEHEYGSFGWGVDPEDNRFELFQPVAGQ